MFHAHWGAKFSWDIRCDRLSQTIGANKSTNPLTFLSGARSHTILFKIRAPGALNYTKRPPPLILSILRNHSISQCLANNLLEATHEVHCLRDPTRGGLSSTLNEIAASSEVGMELDETAILVREEVRGACEMLGLDPLYVANEGKLVAIVGPSAAHAALEALRAHWLGKDASIIGHVTADRPRLVVMRTSFGTTRIVDMLAGDQLPRIR